MLKSIETQAVFIKKEMNYKQNVYFLPNISAGIQQTYLNEFSVYQSLSEALLLMWREAKQLYFKMFFMFLNYNFEMYFQYGKR